MKKWICLFLSMALILSLFGCSKNSDQDPGNFYYRRIQPEYLGDDGIIAPETRDLSGIRDNLEALLESYFLGPQSTHLQAPFPRDTRLVQWQYENHVLELLLSQEFAQLSGIELTVACGCIAKTFLELTDATAVRIQAENSLLDSNSEIFLSKESLKFSDDGVEKLRTDLTLFYTDEDRRYLIGQTLSVNLAALDDVVAYLVEQLKTAPTGLGLVSPLPQETKLISCNVDNGVCTLNLSSEFETNAFPDTFAQRTTLLSLVNTLTQLDSIDRVEFQLEGNLLIRYRQINISKALVYDEGVIGPVRTGVNEFDATLYLCNGSAYLSAVPTRIQYTTGISQQELVVNTLLNYQNGNGFYTGIPSTTVLNRLENREGICVVDLSEDFLSCDDLLLAIRLICASICALDGTESVQVLINGGIPSDLPQYWFEPMTPDRDWFA